VKELQRHKLAKKTAANYSQYKDKTSEKTLGCGDGLLGCKFNTRRGDIDI